ncbi:MAG: hypothetical protein QM570_16975 [Planctomycetota bacterium]|nr:hypothetical protein [Planctomycetota bacterium]
MKRGEYILLGWSACMAIAVTGCPSTDIAHLVRVREGTFAFEQKWWDRTVEYVQILTQEESPDSARPMLPGRFGPCRDVTDDDLKSYGPYTTAWAIRAVAPVSARDFRLIPGQIPDHFEQVVPESPEVFVPVDGRVYYIMGCLHPLDADSVSMAIPWIPGNGTGVAEAGRTIEVEGPFRHEPSGMVFPAQVAAFTRVEIQLYDTEGHDAGVGYALPSLTEPIIVTVYVFPAPSLAAGARRTPSFDEDYEATTREIARGQSGRTLVAEQDIVRHHNGKACPGRMATYDYEGSFAHFEGQIRTHLYLFGPFEGTWFIKYRITHPRKVDASERIGEFMDQWVWTIGSS